MQEHDRIISGINRTINGGIPRKLIHFPPMEALTAYPNALVSIYSRLGENVYTGKCGRRNMARYI